MGSYCWSRWLVGFENRQRTEPQHRRESYPSLC